jgi:hypothetical protein
MPAKVKLDFEADANDAIKDTAKFTGSLQELADQVARSGEDFSRLASIIDSDIATLRAATPENAKFAVSYSEISQALEKGEISAAEAAQKMELLRSEMQQTEAAGKPQIASFEGINSTLMNLSNAINVVQGAYTGLKQVYDATIGKVIEYQDSVKGLALSLGLSTEETSRIIGVANQYGVTTEQITNTLDMMVKRGMAPSINGLAQLSEKFLSIQDPVERAAYMSELLGRNWTQLNEILEKGPDAIKAAAEGLDKSLVISQEQADQTEQLTIEWNKFTQQVNAAGLMIFGRLEPALKLALSPTRDLNKAWAEFVHEIGLGPDPIKEVAVAMGDFRKSEVQADAAMKDHSATTLAQSYAMRALVDATESQIAADIAGGEAAKQHLETEKTLFDNLAAANNNLATAQQSYIDNQANDFASALERSGAGAEKVAAGLKIIDDVQGTNLARTAEYKTKTDELFKAFANGDIDEGQLKTGLENLKTAFGDLDTSVENSKKKIKELQDQIDALHGKTIDIIINQSGSAQTDPTHSTIVPPSPRGGSGAGGGKADQQYANGTNDAPGGLAVVGEQGPEVAYFPPHTQIIPNDQLGGVTINMQPSAVTINAPQNTDPKKLAQMVSGELGKIVRSAIKSGKGYSGNR